MKTKRFDCVEMMHRGAARIYEETKGLSRKAELAYWQERERELFQGKQPGSRTQLAVREPGAAYRVAR